MKSLKKDFPSASEWPTFTGEGESGHITFIEWVDQVSVDMGMPDKHITEKFTRRHKGVAIDWMFETRRDEHNLSWAEKIRERILWKVNSEVRKAAFARSADGDQWGNFLVILEE
ncbi:hypothetical protein CROQUDRAFT_135883 [Cronartium quercuum f. sp. fusiforme G11]|uniref:Uncharacterized protein n=1 Tax=Cronartium quercuum f. sp. fusiforme G11 TaxID=708437 RepID=A0A9P6NDB3_9BASI|nr:hypothetical protein CROQUDRAFT_135883 [Cronartium quercuum f. sp. fusiforme G11]